MTAQEVGKFAAECTDTVLKGLIEHVADHDHSALRPLWVSELSLSAIAEHQRAEQGQHGIAADGMVSRQVTDNLKPFGSEFLHYYRPRGAGRDAVVASRLAGDR